jgi:flagellar biogenesis protein FliO
MSAHEVSAQIASHMISLLAAIGLVCVICWAPVKDAADDDKARAHVEQQAKAQTTQVGAK